MNMPDAFIITIDRGSALDRTLNFAVRKREMIDRALVGRDRVGIGCCLGFGDQHRFANICFRFSLEYNC